MGNAKTGLAAVPHDAAATGGRAGSWVGDWVGGGGVGGEAGLTADCGCVNRAGSSPLGCGYGGVGLQSDRRVNDLPRRQPRR